MGFKKGTTLFYVLIHLHVTAVWVGAQLMEQAFNEPWYVFCKQMHLLTKEFWLLTCFERTSKILNARIALPDRYHFQGLCTTNFYN